MEANLFIFMFCDLCHLKISAFVDLERFLWRYTTVLIVAIILLLIVNNICVRALTVPQSQLVHWLATDLKLMNLLCQLFDGVAKKLERCGKSSGRRTG